MGAVEEESRLDDVVLTGTSGGLAEWFQLVRIMTLHQQMSVKSDACREKKKK